MGVTDVPEARGVAILICKTVAFLFIAMTADPDGGYPVVNGSINSIPVALLDIYAINSDCRDFYCILFSSILLLTIMIAT